MFGSSSFGDGTLQHIRWKWQLPAGEAGTCTVAAVVARMMEPTTSAGTTSNTLCGRWQVPVAMPAQAWPVRCSASFSLSCSAS